ncbi:hypothetical protein Tsubulata_008067 [Turnera subulata]|uniref:RRM domain-containing protein n=1 Tax=Turnera subulata TaxID=218843 RepID=A0A9Q0J9V8_9ROSI|nr:hypothetical protein Tsubulata_008067 [Turnera subulata]
MSNASTGGYWGSAKPDKSNLGPKWNDSSKQRTKPLFFFRWSREAIQQAEEDDKIRTIYLENLPSGWVPSDIYCEMSKFGVVMDIFIPGKLSWNGVRYGFVRRHGGRSARGVMGKEAIPFRPWAREFVLDGKVKEGRSFSQAVASESGNDSGKVGERIGDQDGNGVAVAFNSTNVCMEKLKSCAFGIVSSDVVTYNVCSRIKSLTMGGNHVPLAFKSREVMLACLKSGVLSESGLFEWLKPWEEGDCATNRSCWVNIYGIPPQARCEKFFRLITVRFGSFIKLHNSLEENNDLEVAKVLVLTTYKESIECFFKAMINNWCYEIRVVDVQPSSPFELKCPLGIQVRRKGGIQKGNIEKNSFGQTGESADGIEGANRSGSGENSNSSPDPFGIRDTIKHLGKGKQIKGSGLVMDKKFNAQPPLSVLRGEEEAVYGSCESTFRSKSKASYSQNLIVESETFVADSLHVVSGLGLVRPIVTHDGNPNQVQDKSVGLTGECSRSSDLLSLDLELFRKGCETNAFDEEGGGRRLEVLVQGFRNIIEKTNLNRSFRLRKLKKVTEGGSVCSLRLDDSSTQDEDIEAENKRVVCSDGDASLVSFKATEVSNTINVRLALGLEMGENENNIEQVVGDLIDKENIEWVALRVEE